eukprot:CAMPEP_0204314078 /NCGR_PEP_ID=MMETSP0469-20131031/3998_1 /ASSEMBLY_ACC=CAM_ASM_000384 /TAXON_ID=2969 /ORGANISM="Oxyrrhis marina" /LENGTH=89 /DNA_ID=CAMNT_0051294503 /DNA_START=393 /DNA_END=659 /DNA_ORIENTATION=+
MGAECAGRPVGAFWECFFDASRPERAALMDLDPRPQSAFALLAFLHKRLVLGQELRSLDEVSGRQLSSSASLQAAEPTWEPNVLGGQSV